MAILEVKLDWRGDGGSVNASEATYKERYLVTFDEGTDPRLRKLLAVDSGLYVPNGVPQGYTSHPYNPWLVVVGIEPRALSPFLYEVIVTYSNRPQRTTVDGSQLYANPCDQPWDWEFFTWSKTESIDTDVFGQNIVNANGEQPDPPLQDEFKYAGVRIRRNQSYWNQLYMSYFAGAINSDWFLGHERYTAYCNDVSARRMRHGFFFYWEATFEFLFDDTFIRGQHIGWIKLLEHVGYTVRKSLPAGIKIVRAQVDSTRDGLENKNPTPVPVLLDDNGYRLADTAIRKSYISYDVKPEMPFSALGIY